MLPIARYGPGRRDRIRALRSRLHEALDSLPARRDDDRRCWEDALSDVPALPGTSDEPQEALDAWLLAENLAPLRMIAASVVPGAALEAALAPIVAAIAWVAAALRCTLILLVILGAAAALLLRADPPSDGL